ncbi:POK19 protein, partial [Ptilorrhoa leucosticta]|nr:POK19 protein [Ptilorrhoa leucosticta]
EGSRQVVELAAAFRAFQLFQKPFNLITDSASVANIVKRIEGSVLKHVSNDALYRYLACLYTIVQSRTNQYFVSHIRAHSSLPGFLTEGNSRAKAIINTCPDCQLVQPPVSTGAVNPRGLQSLQLWQTDVTKYLSSGKYKNIHLSVDTFSNAVFASVHTGETAKHVCQHFLQAFASLGVPQEIKTDNGPAYTAQKVATFLMTWGVRHTFGIPYSPTSQAIVEKTCHSLKCILDQQKGD